MWGVIGCHNTPIPGRRPGSPLRQRSDLADGFAPFLLDYDVVTEVPAAKPDGTVSYVLGRCRYRFTHCAWSGPRRCLTGTHATGGYGLQCAERTSRVDLAALVALAEADRSDLALLALVGRRRRDAGRLASVVLA
jgi:hypothetical protein